MSTGARNRNAIATHQGKDARSVGIAKAIGDDIRRQSFRKKGLNVFGGRRRSIPLWLLQAVSLSVSVERIKRHAHFSRSVFVPHPRIKERLHLVAVGHRDVRPLSPIGLDVVLKDAVKRFLLVRNGAAHLASQELHVIQPSDNKVIDILAPVGPKSLHMNPVAQTEQRQASRGFVNNRLLGVCDGHASRLMVRPHVAFTVNDCAEVSNGIRSFIHDANNTTIGVIRAI